MWCTVTWSVNQLSNSEILQSKQSCLIKIETITLRILSNNLRNPFSFFFNSLLIYRSCLSIPTIFLQFISVMILSVSQVMVSLLDISHVLQKPCTQPSLFSRSTSGTPNWSSNLAHFTTKIAPVTCSSFSSMCFTYKTRALSTSGWVTVRAFFPDKAVGFVAIRD